MKNIILSLMLALGISACSETNPEALKGKNFVLESDKNISLSFDTKENKFFGKALNNYMGTYTIEKNKIKFGAVASTMMAGPKEEMDKEYKYMRNLEKVNSYKFSGKKLELIGKDITLTYTEK